MKVKVKVKVKVMVMVMVILDQSGSMCLTDPPGSQTTAGFCETINVVPPGVTQPARSLALSRFAADRAGPLAVVQFDTNVHDEYYATGFAFPGNGALWTILNQLQATLGSRATDYQGALDYAYARISSTTATTGCGRSRSPG